MMNQLVMVTGATGGVGRSICRHLAHSYRVLAIGRSETLLEELRKTVPGITTYCTDLSSPALVSSLLDDLMSQHDYVPYVINNAGLNVASSLSELTLESLESSFRVNAIAPLLIMQRMLPVMRDNDFGRIINITSGAPLNCFPGYGAYSASKAALNALTVTAAREYEDLDIKINLMSPGPVRSAMAPSASMDPEVCHPTLDYLLGLDREGPTGRFFWLGYEIPHTADTEGVDWRRGRASQRFPKVI